MSTIGTIDLQTSTEVEPSNKPIRVAWGRKTTLPSIIESQPLPQTQFQFQTEHITSPDNPLGFLDIELPSLASMVCGENTTLIIDEKPTDQVVGTYTDDFNILEVDDLIQRRFNYNRRIKVEELNRHLTIEMRNLERLQTIVEKKTTLSSINRLNAEITNITSETDCLQYQKDVSSLLDIYRSLGTKTKVISFKTQSDKIERSPEGFHVQADAELRHLVISRYLEIARQYIKIDVIREIPYDNTCPGCGIDFREVIMDDDNGTQCCPNCGIEKYNLTRTSSQSESTKPSSGRNGYDDRDNFLKALRRYEGKQPNRLPENLISILDTHFASYRLPTSDEIKKLSLNDRGIRGDTTRELMYKALYDTKNVAFYEDINLICHLYWGWALPDISHLEDQILEDYDKTQRIYESLPKSRKSNLNIQYRLFKHLEMRGHRCSIDDFKIVKTRDILEYHDSVWKQMVVGAAAIYPNDGFKFVETI